MALNPLTNEPKPPFPQKKIDPPGLESEMNPRPDYGVETYKGTGRLKGKTALVTGGDSGIGRAVALAYAREGANVAVAYLNEHSDAQELQSVLNREDRSCLLIPGDLQNEKLCEEAIEKTIKEYGAIDILVNNAAFQMTRESLDDISADEFDRTFRTNVFVPFYLSKYAVRQMKPGSSIINTVSVNADSPMPSLVAYSATKSALQNMTGSMAQLLAEKGIRVNCVAPGPIWTPFIPSSMSEDQVKNFGSESKMKRPGQPVELAPAYVMLATDEASYISGATIAVTGGKPMI